MDYAKKENKAGSRITSTAFLALPILAIIFSDHTILAVILLLMELTLVAHSYSKAKTQLGKYEILILGFVLIGTPTYIVGHNYFDGKDRRQFASYLAEHQCKKVGTAVVGMTRGGCDRTENCVEPEEIKQPEYLCRATGKRITFDDFISGKYGED